MFSATGHLPQTAWIAGLPNENKILVALRIAALLLSSGRLSALANAQACRQVTVWLCSRMYCCT